MGFLQTCLGLMQRPVLTTEAVGISSGVALSAGRASGQAFAQRC